MQRQAVPRKQTESGAIKPQRGQDQAQVVPGAAHHRVQRIAQRALEWIASEAPVHLPHPGVDHSFVGGIEGALQVQQADDQA